MQMPKIDVHGMTSQEAIQIVRLNLKEFYERGYNEVFIVHGHGQGILKQTIRQLLRQFPYVKSIRRGNPSEGGDGVTVAIF